MSEFEDFKKRVLYRIARADGSMYLSKLASELCKPEDDGETEMDHLDFYLHLRSLTQEENPLLKRETEVVSVPSTFVLGQSRKESRRTVSLTENGWDWVRKSRTDEKQALALIGQRPAIPTDS